MSLLNSIRFELKQVIEAMSAVTNINFTIVDESLMRIVGTGHLSQSVGQIAPRNSVFHKCLTTGQQYFIDNPTLDPICLNCENLDNCNELAELCIPIQLSDKIIGVLGMCAFDEKAKANLINNYHNYMEFQKQLSGIIATILNERKFKGLVEYGSSELTTLINSLNEGIIILNNNKDIMTTNKYIDNRLNIDLKNARTIDTLLGNRIYNILLEKDFDCEIGPVNINGLEFIIHSSPILLHERQQGIILVFSDFNKMRDSVLKSNIIKDIITFDDLIGESEALLIARRQAIQISEKDVTVLLMGESGTGKDIFARAIHSASQRKNDIFMPINCGAIPENLIESELFGYEKGSFTGASVTGKIGKFEISKDGTLFLDEIGDLPFSMQVKLLRALEEKEITRVGGNEPIKVNPRIISATHSNLQKMVLEKSFREDLFYRLNIVPIYIPSLRERGYDIIILSRYFLKHFANIYNKNIVGFTAECERYLLRYTFPGNIRELKNMVEYATIFEENSFIGINSILRKVGSSTDGIGVTLGEMTKAYEKSVIEDQLQRYGEDLDAKREVAKQLGISIATLYRKME